MTQYFSKISQNNVRKASCRIAVLIMLSLLIGCSRDDDLDGKSTGADGDFPNIVTLDSKQGDGGSSTDKKSGYVFVDTGQGMIVKGDNGFHAPKLSIVFDAGISDNEIARVLKTAHVRGVRVNDGGHGKTYIGTTTATSQEEFQQTIMDLSNMPEVLSVR